MSTSASKWVFGAALCGLIAFSGVASRFRPLKPGFFFQERALSGRRADHSAGGRYDVRYALPELDKLVVNLNGAIPPDSVFLAPEESGLTLLNAQDEHQISFKSLKEREGRLHLQIMASGKFLPVPEKGYTLRIGIQGLSDLVIEDGMFFQSLRVPILSAGPIRKPDFSLEFPKYCFLDLEVDVPNTLTLKENGGLGGFANYAASGNIAAADSRVRGKTHVLYAQNLTTSWDLQGLDVTQAALSADRYAVVRLGNPQRLTLRHLVDGVIVPSQRGEQQPEQHIDPYVFYQRIVPPHRGERQPVGMVSYRGSPTIRERFPRGERQLRLVGKP